MKKLSALLLSFAMMLSLAACGGGNDKVQQSDASSADKESSESVAQSSQTSSSERFLLSETTILDNDLCSFKITGAEVDSFDGFVLRATMENKSNDKTLSFTLDNTVINGVQSFSFFWQEVTPGNKANANVTFVKTKLEQNGIKDFTDIELTAVATNTDNLTDEVGRGTAHIYPYGQDKATAYVREAKPTDVVLLDNDAATVTMIGTGESEFGEVFISLYVVNKTDKKISVSAGNTAVNGIMLDPGLYESISAGKSSFVDMKWMKSDLESNGITKLEKVEAPLEIKDYESYNTLVKETVMIQL